MNISEKGVSLIKAYESFFENAYQDVVGIWTIGWGTIEYPNGDKVKKGDICNRIEAERWLAYELHLKQADVLRITEGANLNQNQFDALVSLAYNIGADAISSSFLKIIKNNASDSRIVGLYDKNYKIFGQLGRFIQYCNAGGKPIKGLIRRRKSEAYLYLNGEINLFEEVIKDTKTQAKEYIFGMK
jgi:lysozyme